MWRQFAIYVGKVATGDFGKSVLTSQPVLTDIKQVFPATLELATLGTLIGILLGIPNYFTVALLVAGLRTLPAVVFFPANNIGQLILGSLAGALLYRERLDALTWVGVGLAATAIILLVI